MTRATIRGSGWPSAQPAPAATAATARKCQPHAADETRDVVRAGREPAEAPGKADHSEHGRHADERGPDDGGRMDQRVEGGTVPCRRASRRPRPARPDQARPTVRVRGLTRSIPARPRDRRRRRSARPAGWAGRSPGRPRRRSATRGGTAAPVDRGQPDVGRRRDRRRVRMRVDDAPEDLAGVVRLDGQAQQVVRVDLVARWRRGRDCGSAHSAAPGHRRPRARRR